MAARACRSDPGLTRRDPRRALAAKLEWLAELDRRLAPVEAAVGRRSREVLAIDAGRRVGTGARLFGQSGRPIDVCIEFLDARRLLGLLEQRCECGRRVRARRCVVATFVPSLPESVGELRT